MSLAESWVPASICMACSSVEGASTLSEVRVVGLYQYISLCVLLPERTISVMFPLLRALKHLPRGSEVLDPSSYRFTDRNRGAAMQRPRRFLAYSRRL